MLEYEVLASSCRHHQMQIIRNDAERSCSSVTVCSKMFFDFFLMKFAQNISSLLLLLHLPLKIIIIIIIIIGT